MAFRYFQQHHFQQNLQSVPFRIDMKTTSKKSFKNDSNLTEWYARAPSALTGLVANLRNRTGEERREQTLCDKRDNNFV